MRCSASCAALDASNALVVVTVLVVLAVQAVLHVLAVLAVPLAPHPEQVHAVSQVLLCCVGMVPLIQPQAQVAARMQAGLLALLGGG